MYVTLPTCKWILSLPLIPGRALEFPNLGAWSRGEEEFYVLNTDLWADIDHHSVKVTSPWRTLDQLQRCREATQPQLHCSRSLWKVIMSFCLICWDCSPLSKVYFTIPFSRLCLSTRCTAKLRITLFGLVLLLQLSLRGKCWLRIFKIMFEYIMCYSLRSRLRFALVSKLVDLPLHWGSLTQPAALYTVCCYFCHWGSRVRLRLHGILHLPANCWRSPLLHCGKGRQHADHNSRISHAACLRKLPSQSFQESLQLLCTWKGLWSFQLRHGQKKMVVGEHC